MAEKANVFSASNNRAYSNGRSRKNKYSDDKEIRTRERSTFQKGPLCNGCGPRKKLLYLWRVWAHDLPLQKPRRKSSSRKEIGI